MLKQIWLTLVALILLFSPSMCLALTDGGVAQDAAFNSFFTGMYADLDINNGDELPDLVQSITTALFSLLGVIAVILIVYAGLLWVTAAGADERVKKAKQIIRGTIIAMLIVSVAYGIVTFVIGIAGT